MIPDLLNVIGTCWKPQIDRGVAPGNGAVFALAVNSEWLGRNAEQACYLYRLILVGVTRLDSGVPVPGVPNVSFDQFTQLLLPALGIALLAYPDSFLTASSLASSGDYTLDADQEFLALGASNVVSGFLQGIPVNGSQSRSFVQGDAGGTSNLVGLICAGLALGRQLIRLSLLQVFDLPILNHKHK